MNASERAAQIWPILVFVASYRQSTDYETLSRLIRVPQKSIGPLLELIRRCCLDRGLPDLTSVVTRNAGTALPADVRAVRTAVFHHPWLREPTPAPADFERVLSRNS